LFIFTIKHQIKVGLADTVNDFNLTFKMLFF